MQNLTVALLQCDLHWENPTKNFTAITECLESNTASFDLLVLPEINQNPLLFYNHYP